MPELKAPKQVLGPGTYVLLIRMEEEAGLRVGALGEVPFRRGWYLYVGSALGGLVHRLERHLRDGKRLHWHVDYLLQRGRVLDIWVRATDRREECRWAQTLRAMPGVEPYLARFGASDCRCPTHLFYSEDRPGLEAFRAHLGDGAVVRACPSDVSGVSPGGEG